MLVFGAGTAGEERLGAEELEALIGDGGDAPVFLSSGLANDTGRSASDGITSDPAIAGQVSDDAGIAKLELRFGEGSAFADITAALAGDGTFSLGRAALEQALGRAIGDGLHAVTLRATGGDGQRAETGFAMQVDTAIQAVQAALAVSSDTGTAGDAITSLRSVKLTGQGEPGATVEAGGISSVVAANGSFALNGVAVALGTNDIVVTTTDAAGNSSQTLLEITGIAAVEGQPVLVWNDIALEAIAGNADIGTGASRVLAMQSVAVHDVIAAIDGTQAFMVDETAADGASLAAAIAQASHAVLSYAYPAFRDALDAYLAEALADVPDGAAEDAGIALGQAVADQMIRIRSADGWDDFETYPGSADPGKWRETGPLYEVAVDPQWATMTPWALTGADQFRVGAPPALNSQAYADAVNEVKSLGSATSTTRTADMSEAARFWKDGRGTETTPGHWNSIATDLMKAGGASSSESARALAILNVSMADAMIAAWDSKYAYGLWRPQDAIRMAETDGNPATAADKAWQPFMLAPAHPEYVSGHSVSSGAAAGALTALFGGETGFTTESLGLAGVERSFGSFWEAAEENANSRLWAGVHYAFSNTAGLAQGAEVAQWALNAFDSVTDTAAPVVILDVAFGYASGLPFAVNGAALDTLSGVAKLRVTIDDGNPDTPAEVRELAFDAKGGFSAALGEATADGTYTLAFRAEDAAGNLSKTVTSTVTVDTADPELELTSLEDGALRGTAARLAGTIDGTGAPVIALAYQIDGGRTYSLTFNKSTGAFDRALNLSAVGEGEHVVSVIAADAAGNSIREDFALILDEPVPFVVTDVSPASGATEVGATFRPEIHFSRAVDPDTVTADTVFLTGAAGQRLPSAVKVSADGLKAWVFPEGAMPGATKIKLAVTDGVKALDGTALDGDGDGTEGGDLVSDFTTVSTTAVPGTTLSGYVVDPGDDLKPLTVDDYSVGPDGTDFTGDDVFLSPIAGAEVFVLGLEHIKAITDENGYFELTNLPSGNVKVAVEGRTATNAPEGVFWPEMVMDVTIIAGQANTLMAGMGTVEEREAVAGRGEVYLPRVQTDILKELSETEATEIGVPAKAAQDLTTEQREAIRLVVQPGSAVDASGNPVEGAQVGISTVPPELVLDMLPEGVMQHTFDLTIQSPDSAVFTTPAELTLPNVFDAAPGTKLNILSFDHTTGRLVIEGTATVSADGKTVTSDPGTGITKPGWHGLTPPGGNGCNGGDPLGPDEKDPEVPDPEEADETEVMALYSHDGEGGIRFKREWTAPDPLEETPPSPGGDEDCPEAAEDLEDKEQPWINVKIEIDGPLADFAKKSGNLGLTDTEFTLRAGTNAERGFAFSMKTFEEMFGAGGLKNVEKNQLYGSKITITERVQDADGNQTVTKEEIFVTRYVDATDDNHTDAQTEFNDAVVDGVAREVPLEVKGTDGLTVEVADTTHFQASNSKITFDPGATGSQSTQLNFKYDGGNDVPGAIALKGKGAEVQKFLVDTASIVTTLAAIANGTDANTTANTTAAEKQLFDNSDNAMPPAANTERADIAAAIKTKTEAFFTPYNAGLAPGAAGDSNLMTLKFLTTSSGGLLGDSAPGGGIDKAADIKSVVDDRADWSKAEQNFRLDKAINQSFTGTVESYINTPLEYRAVATATALENTLAKTAAHELGHTLGLRHTGNSSGTKVVNVGGVAGSTDFMQQGLDFNANLSVTSITDGALKLASNIGYTVAEAQAALSYYVAHYALGAFDLVLETAASIVADAVETGAEFLCGCGGNHAFVHEKAISVELADAIEGYNDPQGEGAPIEGVAVAVFDLATGLLLGGDVEFGTVLADGPGGEQAVRSIQIISIGSEPLELDGVWSASSAVSVEGLDGPLELGLGETLVLDIVFDPAGPGAQDTTVSFASNAGNGLADIAVAGSAVTAGPSILVTTQNSNIGGVDRGTAETAAEMFTIANRGVEDLVIDAITLDPSAASFALTGLPADLAADPITLSTGETFSFGVSFTGVAPGLSRGAIAISSNDAASPVTEVAAAATSYEDLLYFDWGNDYVAIDIAGDTLRTVSDEDGDLMVFLPAEEDYKITVFDPESGLVAVNYGTTSPSGQGTDLTSGLVFKASAAVDADFDGLAADIEHAIGTSDINADSNGDGISDFDALAAGVAALDPFATNLGVVRTLELDGEIKAMFATRGFDAGGTASDPLLVLTATGLSVIDVTDPREPVLSSVTAIADVKGGAFDPALEQLLVLGTDGTLSAWNLADPAAPANLGTVATGVSQVTARDGRALAAVAGTLRLFDLATGEELDSVNLGPSVSSVRSLAQDGAFAYALDNRGSLSVIELFGDELVSRGSVSTALSSGDRKMFAAEGIVYIPAGNGFQGGYQTYDVSDPDAPALISGADDTSLAGTAIALNGAGRGLLVGDPGGVFGTDAIDVVNTADSADTGALITRYQIDTRPTDVAIAAGVGYVGTTDGKLHIVNFQPFDTSGVPPEVALAASGLDVDPDTPGVQILEGTLLSLDATITDDAGLKSVSLLVNGDPISVDISYPFDLSARIPLLAEGEDARDVTLQVRATDTGGNIGLSQLIEAEIVPDTIPPMLIDSTLEEGALYGRSKRSFTFTFDEPLDPETDPAAAFRLTGPSGLVDPDIALLLSGDRVVRLVYPELEEGAHVMTLPGGGITDLAGNAYSETDIELGFELGSFSNEWTGAAGDGLWGTAENWSAGRVPEAEDDVFVGNLTGGVALQNLGTVALKSLVAEAPITIGFNTTLATEFDAILDELILSGSFNSRVEIGTAAEIGTLEMQGGIFGGAGTVNVTEKLDWTAGTFERGGLLTVENGAVAEFGRDFDPEVAPPSPASSYLYRDLLLAGSGVVGSNRLYLGTQDYDADLGQNVNVGGRFTIAAGAELELANFNSDILLGVSGSDAGIENLGTLRKTGGGTSTVVPFAQSLGEVVIEDGFIAIPANATLRLSSEDDLDLFAGLKLEGGTLILEDDVTLGNFQMASGTVGGPGTLTLTGTAAVTGGTFSGAGDVVVPEGALLTLGHPYDPDEYRSIGYPTLGRDIIVEGEVDHANADLRLGTRTYNSETAQFDYADGALRIAPGGTYTFSSPFADMNVNYPAQNTASGLLNEGGIVKTGGGASGAAFFGTQTGSFDFRDGILEITDGAFLLTQDLVDAGFDRLQISGGTVTIDEEVTLAALSITGGTLAGAGAAEIAELDWNGGSVTLDGGLSIAEDATARIGSAYPFANAYLGTTLSVGGTLVFENNARLYLGRNDGTDHVPGLIDVGAGGTVEFGRDSSLYDNTSGNALSGLTGSGAIVKSGTGTSGLMLQDFTGSFDAGNGRFVLQNGVSTISQAAIDGGLSDLVISGATVRAEGDLVLGGLEVSGGRLDGAGDVTVGGRFDWTGGALTGSGGITLAEGGAAQFGFPIEESSSTRTLYLGREMTLAGGAAFGNANLYLGYRYYDGTIPGYVDLPGFLTVAETGTLDFRNTAGEIRIYNSGFFGAGEAVGLVNLGGITSSLGSQTTNVAFARNEGTVDAAEGRLAVNGGVLILDGDTDAGLLDLAAVLGGTVSAAEDVTLARLDFRGGTLAGPGDLTVDTRLDWRAGTFGGTGQVIIADGAEAEIGAGPDGTATLYLRQDLVIGGEASFEGLRLRLGDYYNDAGLGQNVNTPGRVLVDASGTLRLVGEASDLDIYRSTGGAASSGNALVNDGLVVKSGGGASSVSGGVQIEGSGVFLTEDGFLEIGSGATFVIDGPVTVANLRLNGGTLDVQADAAIANLEIAGGTVTGGADLTVTESLVQTGGTLAGAGTLIVGAGAEALFGSPWTGTSDPGSAVMAVARNLAIEGTAVIEQAELRLGIDDAPDIGIDVTVAAGGVLEFDGARARLRDYRSSAGEENRVINDGTIRKTGGGIADIDPGILVSGGGTIEASEGMLATPIGDFGSFAPPPGTPVYADAVGNGVTRVLAEADGVSEISVTGGVLQVDEDITLDNLSMTNGRIEGTGRITVTGRFDWEGGDIRGNNEIVVRSGAEAVIGAAYDVEAPANHGNLHLGGRLVIEGTALQSQAVLRLGSLTAGEDAEGVLEIAAGGSYVLDGWRADINRYRDGSDGSLSQIIVDGSLSKTGGGESLLSGLPVSGTGTVAQSGDGTLRFQSGSMAFDAPGFALSGEVILSAGTMAIGPGADLSGLTGLTVTGGTLILSGDLEIPELSVLGGAAEISDTVTVTDSFALSNATIRGGGEIAIADGAAASLVSTQSYTVNSYLGVTLTVNGDLAVERSNVRLGTNTYDAELGQYVQNGGRIEIAASGSLTLQGEDSDILNSTNETGFENGVSVAGSLVKTGGGSSRVHNLSFGDGAGIDIVDGVLELTGGRFELSQEIVDAGLGQIRVSGGELVLDGDVTLAGLEMTGGQLLGDGDLTVTSTLAVGNATLKGGDLVIAAAATGTIANGYYGSIGRDLAVEGTLRLGDNTYIGRQEFDNDLGEYVQLGGHLDIGAAGRLELPANGAVYLGFPLQEGGDHGVSSAGTISSEGNIRLPFAPGGGIGTVELNGGTLILSQDMTLTQAMVDAGIDAVRVVSGTLTIDEDVTLGTLELHGGGLAGSGEVTVAGSFEWLNGSMSGSGTTLLAATADVQFGHDWEQTSATGSGTLARALEVGGAADFGNLYLSLGQRLAYDPDLGDYPFDSGILAIAETGSLTIGGDRSRIIRTYSGHELDESGIANAGQIVKTGGGATPVSLASNSGSFVFEDGVLTLREGELTLTQALIDAGFSEIVIESGSVVMSEALTLDTLTVTGGELVAEEGLTVTGSFDWSGGGIRTGAAAFTIAGTATATWGAPFDPENPTASDYLYLRGNMDIAGSVAMGAVQVELGGIEYDSEAGEYMLLPGSVDILEGGSLAMDGSRADFRSYLDYGEYEFYYGTGTADTAVAVGVNNQGSLAKTSGGTSGLVLYGEQAGSFDQGSGAFALSGGFAGGASQTVALTADMAANGLGDVLIDSSILEVGADVTLASLRMTGGAALIGGGDLTVSEWFQLESGALAGTGTLIVGSGATGRFGIEAVPDQYNYPQQIQISQAVEIRGTGIFEQAETVLGGSVDEFAFLETEPQAGTVFVTDTGTLIFAGALSDVTRGADAPAGEPSGFDNAGTLVRSGAGTTTIAEELGFSSSGTIIVQGGAFDAPGTEFDFGL